MRSGEGLGNRRPGLVSLTSPRPPIVLVVVEPLVEASRPRILPELPLSLLQLLAVDRGGDVVLRSRCRPPPARSKEPPEDREQGRDGDPGTHRISPTKRWMCWNAVCHRIKNCPPLQRPPLGWTAILDACRDWRVIAKNSNTVALFESCRH